MSNLYGALFTGVTGLQAQTQTMSIISDNIANVNTTGYKEVKARFSTLVTDSMTETTYTSGGIRSMPLLVQDKQGLLRGSATETDIAINGDGFFVVADAANNSTTTANYAFTRAGSFRPDKDGNLVNTAGKFLQAWPYNENSDRNNTSVTLNGINFGTDGLPVNKTSLDNVRPVNVSDLTGAAQESTSINLRVNLDASHQQQTKNVEYTEETGSIGGIPASVNTVSATQLVNMKSVASGDFSPDFQRSISIFDAQGVSHDVSLNFVKIGVDPNLPTLVQTVTNTSTTGNGNTLTVSALVGRTDIPTSGGTIKYSNASATGFTENTLTYTSFDPSTGRFTFGNNNAVWSGPGNANIEFPTYQPVANQWGVEIIAPDSYNTAQQTSSGSVNITNFTNNANGTYTVSVDMANGGNTPFIDLNTLVLDGETQSGGGSFSMANYTAGTAASDDNAVNQDFVYQSVSRSGNTLNFVVADNYFNGRTGLQAGSASMTIANKAVHQDGLVGFGRVQFNADGSLNTGESNIFIADYTAGQNPPMAYRRQTLENSRDYEIVWNPSSTGASGSNIDALVPQTLKTINFGANGQTNGLSQYQGTSIMYSHDVDGSVFGNFSNLTIDSEGWVVANFTNGVNQRTHKIPLATVANPAGLSNKDGNTYQITNNSGNFNLNEAGTGTAGRVAGSSLEGSTVDLGSEFTDMIVMQRAYGAASKIITTADRMLTQLMSLKR